MHQATLTRAVRFRAEHRYHRADWSAERNREVFGDQGTLHAHDYVAEVSVAGPVDPETGWVLDLGVIDRALEDRVVSVLQGQAIHEVVPRFAPGGAQASTEELARWIFDEIEAELNGREVVVRVCVRESESLWADYTRLEDGHNG